MCTHPRFNYFNLWTILNLRIYWLYQKGLVLLNSCLKIFLYDVHDEVMNTIRYRTLRVKWRVIKRGGGVANELGLVPSNRIIRWGWSKYRGYNTSINLTCESWIKEFNMENISMLYYTKFLVKRQSSQVKLANECT